VRLKAAAVALVVFAIADAPSMPQAQQSPGAGPVIVLETVKGTVEIETYPEDAPKTVARIVELVKKNFYNGLRFHRAEANFLVQIGDPVSRDMSREAWWGRNPGTGKPIGVGEITKARRHTAGAVAMAHAGDPKLADTQFYIMLRPAPSLDGKHAVFGRVISGLDVVQKIRRADMLKKASVRE
jgi:cyclophilin family peptidyl-prolyl cis-trans isomerase